MNKKKSRYDSENWFVNFMMITIIVSGIFFAFHPLAGMLVFLGNWFNVKNWYELSN